MELIKVFHLCDNSKLDKNDRMSKVRPFYDMMNAKCLKLRPNSPNLSVDEAMLPYFGRNSCKQRMQNKPVRVGYKMWVLAEESGYVVGFDPYQGAKTGGPQRSTSKTWGLGERVVLELVEKLPKGAYHVFMDNFFTSVRLFRFLDRNNIRASGTLRQNRISKSCNVIRKDKLDKVKRGTSVQETASDNSVTVVGWKDSKGLYFASNCDPKSPEVSVQRYCREARRRIPVSQPLMIRNYNKSMGGVDRADENIVAYRISCRSKKWWWALFAWVPDIIMQNAWILYRKNKLPTDPHYDLVNFRLEVIEVYSARYGMSPVSASGRSSVSSSIRHDQHGHFSAVCATTKRCGLCKKTTRKWCPKCQKGVHDRCFNEYHGF